MPVAILCALLAMIIVYMGLAGTQTRYTSTPGSRTSKNGKVSVDYSNASDGYIAVKHDPTDRKTKLRISYGKTVDTYDLATDGEYYIFPLKNGSGTYTVSVYAQASGTKYAQVFGTDISAKIPDAQSCYLYPNQRVWWTEDSTLVKLADELCDGLDGDLNKIQALYKWVSANIKYDYIKAVSAENTYLPNNENTIITQTGMCYDYASLLCAMLRSQGIYSQLAVGSLNKTLYHAWVRVLVNGEWKMLDPTFSNKYTSSSYKLDRVF